MPLLRTISRFAKCVLLLVLWLLTTAYSAAPEAQEINLVVQTGHTGPVSEVAFSPDGRTLASGGWDNSIKLWSVKSGQQLKSLDGHTGWVWSLAFSPDGKTLASGSGDKTIKLWDVESGREIKTLSGHDDWVQPVAFSPDGQTLASGGRDKTVRLWSVASGRQLNSLTSHTDWVYAVAFSLDGKTLASGGSDATIKLWEVETGREIKSLTGHTRAVLSISFSRDGETLVSGSSDQTIRLWNLESGQEIKSLKGHDGSVYSVKFSPDEKTLASGGGDNTAKLWNLESGRQIKSLDGHTGWVHSVVFSPDGKALATGSFDNTVKLWNVETGRQLDSLDSHTDSVHSVRFSPDGKTLAAGGNDNTVKIWNLESGQEIRSIHGHTSSVESVAFSPDGKTLASGGYDKTVRLWNLETGRQIKFLVDQDNPVQSVAFSPDGNTLVSGGDGNAIRVWNVKTGELIQSLDSSSGDVTSIAFSPDGKSWAYAGNASRVIRLLNLDSGQEIKSFSLAEKNDRSWSIAFSPDGKILASGSDDNTFRWWNVESGQEMKPLTDTKGVQSVAFSPDGKTLASGRDDNTITLWEVETGREITSLTGHASTVDSIAFSPDGRFLASGSYDATIKLWDARDYKLLATLISLDRDDWVVTTPDGRFDTNRSLDRIEGMHWVIKAESFEPLPLDIFMRQYYEPDLLRRILSGERFKPLPSIAEINRVQPKVIIREIKPAGDADDSADVFVEVQNVTEDITLSTAEKTMRRRFSSGVFDLRLFRDGQMVAASTPAAVVQRYDEASPGLSDDDETKLWRTTNDLQNLKDVKFDSGGRATFTFRNVRLPRNGEKQAEFSAYAFNADRVKSNTDRKTYDLPATASNVRKKGRAYLLTIGVNTSDNPHYNLRYAANDARKMQEVVGARLKAEVGGMYAEVIQIPLISDVTAGEGSNDARKKIIKGVFSLLSGHREEVPKDVLERIDKIARVPAVEPEDTLIIAFSGHGYADHNGIFYMLPADIPSDTTALTTEALRRTISSDEFSLWMRDITAKEMLMIVDACHSSAAVQGDGFKPGPMGSRGLGQLAYDKGMRILTATQSDNVALEFKRLQHGLLTYALVKVGIEDGEADTEVEFKQLTAAEWLGFAVRAVPRLYEDIRAGKRGVVIGGRDIFLKQKGRDVSVDLSGNPRKTSGVNLQQPSLFDFRRKKIGEALFNLP